MVAACRSPPPYHFWHGGGSGWRPGKPPLLYVALPARYRSRQDGPRQFPMAERVKRIDQQRHELKALRSLLHFYPESVAKTRPLPHREDFQIADCRRIYDALMAAATRDDATAAIRQLDLEETDVESFLRLGGEYYYTYPQLIV